MRKFKNNMLLVLLVFILPGRIYAQNKIHVDLVDSVKNQLTEVTFGVKDTVVVTKKDSMRVYIITNYFLNNYLHLIELYKKKDDIRVQYGNSMETAYQLLFDEYKNMADTIRTNLEKSSGLMTGVQTNINAARRDVETAQTNILGAKGEIEKTSLIIANAQDSIKSAISDLQKVKKRNQAWIYTAVGVGGLLVGMLISR